MIETEFLSAMARLGFIAMAQPRPGFAYEFIHPETGPRRYCAMLGETFLTALDRFTLNLRAHREIKGRLGPTS